MKITIIKGNNLLTPPLQEYIEGKVGVLAKLLTHFDEKGEAELLLEISRTTNHHKKGEVYLAVADLRLPHKILRAEAAETDIHTSIDKVRDMLRLEIDKYKTQFMSPRRGDKSER